MIVTSQMDSIIKVQNAVRVADTYGEMRETWEDTISRMHAHVTYKSQSVNTGDGDTAPSGECTFVVRYTDKIKVGSRIVWEDRTYLVRKDPLRYKIRGYVEADAQLINM